MSSPLFPSFLREPLHCEAPQNTEQPLEVTNATARPRSQLSADFLQAQFDALRREARAPQGRFGYTFHPSADPSQFEPQVLKGELIHDARMFEDVEPKPTKTASTAVATVGPRDVAAVPPPEPKVHVNNGVQLSEAYFDSTRPRRVPEKTQVHPEQPHPVSGLYEASKGAYQFLLGGIAGAVGATLVFPIDLAKTLLQAQATNNAGEPMYKNGVDCLAKVLRSDGVRGLWSGLGPILVGLTPEKATKLSVNDIARFHLQDPVTGKISVKSEIAAGAIAGACQVTLTCPMEMVKVRQMVRTMSQGATAAPRLSALQIVRQLGFRGMYKGMVPCMWRDVPFTVVYFLSYEHLKKDLFHEGKDGKKLGLGELLTAASASAMPAAFFTTPADVLKTRAQSSHSAYHGIVDCFTNIVKNEGAQALFKGSTARVIRSAPQFGATLVVYEYLQKWLPFPWSP